MSFKRYRCTKTLHRVPNVGRSNPSSLGAHWIHFVWDFSLLRHFFHSVRRLARSLLKACGMRSLAAFLAIIIVAQPAVSFGGQDDRSIAVQPLIDGDSDEASRELAAVLGDALGISTPHHVVASDVAANVVGYRAEGEASNFRYSEAASLIAQAKEHYFNFRYKDAEGALAEAVSILESASDPYEGAPLLLDAYLSIALIANSKREKDAAREALGRALELNPLLDLGREDYPPSVVALFDEVKVPLDQRPKGSLFVRSLPEGAGVRVNGIDHGVAPFTLEGLPAGSYSVVVAANRYAPRQRSVTVVAGERTDVKVKLRWSKGKRGSGGSGAATDAAKAVREGVRIAGLLKVDKVILVDADLSGGGSMDVTARTVDRALRAGQRPLVVKGVNSEQRERLLAEMVAGLADDVEVDVAAHPTGTIDPFGEGDPLLLGRRRKPLVKQPLFWGGVGAVAIGAIVGGILASMSGGSDTGSIKVSFK